MSDNKEKSLYEYIYVYINRLLLIPIFLGDFGVSCLLMGSCDLATTFTGTPYYMSPEVLKHQGYNTKSDIWWVVIMLFSLD